MGSVFTSVDHDKFKALRITHLAARFEELIKDEANDAAAPEELFLTAVDEALELRRSIRIEKLIRQAKFPIPEASVAELNYPPGRNLTPVRMKRYATHEWRADPTNLLIISPTGGGKTYLACAIGIAACHSEHSVHYTRMDDLARQLVIARGDGIGHQNMLNKLSDVDLLIIDDLCEASHKSSNVQQKIMRSSHGVARHPCASSEFNFALSLVARVNREARQ
ncbi:IstB-like ATP binding protein [Cryobacterium luteum]|nr:IstB-like ATP binding protein [Cryobacterium luteum]